GYVPNAEDINIEGLADAGITLDVVKDLLSVDNDLWLEDADGVEEFYKTVGDRMPEELYNQLAAFRNRLK
ncbi:MAG: phosphoenolpyruvate carboxykinase (GTP), partial [Clostridia bacterium]|nr:phosphoenolpyruvate carboxykinase (GTP) [Clostridia bacterium]